MRRRHGVWSTRAAALLIGMALLLPCAQGAHAEAAEAPDAPDTDLLVVCAHPGDEFLFFGGVLSLYAGEQGRRVAVLYLAPGGTGRRELAQKALATLQTPVEVIFGEYTDYYTDSLKNAEKLCEERDVVAYLTGQIRMLRPAVIVTHEAEGEYGHGMHQMTSNCVLQAAEAAGEESRFNATAQTYGCYTPQRVFLHLGGGVKANIDRTKPLTQFDGRTVLEQDRLAYAVYAEVDGYPLCPDEERQYTRADYGLVFSRDPAPEDLKGDLFFGMDAETLGAINTPKPTATLTPTPTFTPAPTAKPTPTPTVTPETTEAKKLASGVSAIMERMPPASPSLRIAAYALLVLTLAGLALLIRFPVPHRRVYAVVWSVLAVLSLLYILYAAAGRRALAPAFEETTAPASTPAHAATPDPTATPTATATPTPDPWAQYFRSGSDPAEVIVQDETNEHWEYRTDTLSVLIDRIHDHNAEGGPVCYQIAHIRMREDAFRVGLRGEGVRAGIQTDLPWEMARDYHAVLAITGDNLNRAEVHLKGILIRNGYVYSDNQAQDTMAIYPDMTMRIFKRHETTPEELLADGVLHAFSFGPTLLRDGVIDRTARRGALGAMNPRCGLGYVEPGHFIAITVDGRQSSHSRGVSMKQFAHLFYINGCTEAYNLDGGSSTAMVFMGEYLTQHRGTGSDIQRPWADAILFGESDAVPSRSDPLVHSGDAEK